jgi:hypothetical protein
MKFYCYLFVTEKVNHTKVYAIHFSGTEIQSLGRFKKLR